MTSIIPNLQIQNFEMAMVSHAAVGGGCCRSQEPKTSHSDAIGGGCCRSKAQPGKCKDACATAVDGDALTANQVFEYIRTINDPEFPQSLEDLKVVREEHVTCEPGTNKVHIFFTPTIPHCSMATLIGLAIRVRLLRRLSPSIKACVEISPGSHVNETTINKQLDDKERVAAALENKNLLEVINQCLDDGTD